MKGRQRVVIQAVALDHGGRKEKASRRPRCRHGPTVITAISLLSQGIFLAASTSFLSSFFSRNRAQSYELVPLFQAVVAFNNSINLPAPNPAAILAVECATVATLSLKCTRHRHAKNPEQD
jgi:hypothetical protein